MGIAVGGMARAVGGAVGVGDAVVSGVGVALGARGGMARGVSTVASTVASTGVVVVAVVGRGARVRLLLPRRLHKGKRLV